MKLPQRYKYCLQSCGFILHCMLHLRCNPLCTNCSQSKVGGYSRQAPHPLPSSFEEATIAAPPITEGNPASWRKSASTRRVPRSAIPSTVGVLPPLILFALVWAGRVFPFLVAGRHGGEHGSRSALEAVRRPAGSPDVGSRHNHRQGQGGRPFP